MKNSRINKITLRESRIETDISILEAKIADNGDLMLEGYDLGDAPQEFWGDGDYEYWRIVKKKYKGRILHLLIKERFDSDPDFEKWLDEKGIPGKSRRRIGKGYEDTALLWLIKERFDMDTKFKGWLDERGIPASFWSWA